MLREGDTLAGRYRLATELGSGGMSAVWLAEDVELDRRVAVKLLAPTADRTRFEREARAHAACAHSNVARVFDYGEIEGRPYLVLEHLPGGTLEDRLHARAPLPDRETIRIAREVANGMAHAHARGLVHRDLKPANILFDDEGRAKVADFGIAHATDASTLTDEGTILGTAAYASPEQARGRPVTPASDVYSFGVMLFRMLTGRLPFAAASSMELLLQHAQADPPPVGRFRSDAPPHLEALVASALAKDPDARPSDGAALVTALTGQTSPAPAPDTAATEVLARAQRRPSRHAVLGVAAALTVLGSAGIAAAILAFGSSPSEPAPVPAGTRVPARQGSASGPESTSSTSPASTTSRPRTTTRDDGAGERTGRTTPVGAEPTTPGVTSTATATTAEPTTTEETTTPTTPESTPSTP